MEIVNCLLDSKNEFRVGVKTVGMLVEADGKRHYWEKREGGVIDTVVIHGMSAYNFDRFRPFGMDNIMKAFCKCGVSCHYVIGRSGKVFRLVPEKEKAWHCGPSIMPAPDNRTGVNDFSIGIELVGLDGEAFSKAQYRSLVELCQNIEKRYDKKMIYVGHDQIAGERAVKKKLRAEAKTDPGPMFEWDEFMQSLRK